MKCGSIVPLPLLFPQGANMVPIVEYRKVALSLPNGQVLKDIDFVLYRGELCLIIGENSSGKTSFLRSLYVDIPIKSGTARVLQANIHDISAKEALTLRRQMGLVFEHPELFEDKTVFTNCATVLRAFGWKDHTQIEERVRSVLRDFHLVDKSHALAAELSAGEQRRLAIARALVHQPQLLIADTPFTYLDRFWRHRILQHLTELCRRNQMATVISTRDANLADIFEGKKYLLKADSLLPYEQAEG